MNQVYCPENKTALSTEKVLKGNFMKSILLVLLAVTVQIASAQDAVSTGCKDKVIEYLSAHPKLKDYYLKVQGSRILQPGETIYVRADDWPNTQQKTTEAVYVEASYMGVLMYVFVVQADPKTCEIVNTIVDKIDFD